VINSAIDKKIEHLYHYQPFNNEYISDLLLNHRIKFSNPATFNDPWDCRLNFAKRILDDPKIYKDNVDYAIDIQRRHYEIPEIELARRAQKLLEDRPFLEARIDEISIAMNDAITKDYRVYCMSTKPDSSLMWAHYSKHDGVCFGFKTQSKVFCSALEVTYAKEYPQLNPAENDECKFLRDVLFTKAEEWGYECEFRLIGKESNTESFLSLSDGFLTFEPTDLQFVVVGSLMHDDQVQVLREILTKRRVPVTLLKAFPEKEKYNLVLQKL
jgi:hypothetical protein